MKIIVGLGNPGKEFVGTPHNAGFLLIDKLANQLSKLGYSVSEFVSRKKLKSDIAEVYSPKGKRVVVLVKPTTYMNLSGSAVSEVCRSYGVKDLENMLVAYDELDIELGKVKYSPVKNSRTHKGINSIISTVGKSFHSLRIGVDNRQGRNISGMSYVLKRYSEAELVDINIAIAESITMYLLPFLGIKA